MATLTVFYDATCPLCVKEMKALGKHDELERIKTVDIFSQEVKDYPQIDPQRASDILHAIDEKGTLLLGLDAAHRAWQLVGRGWLYAPLRWRGVKPVADWLYLQFARHRYLISRLLTGQSRCNCK